MLSYYHRCDFVLHLEHQKAFGLRVLVKRTPIDVFIIKRPDCFCYFYRFCYSHVMKRLTRLLLNCAYPLLQVYWFLCRPSTTGVRCLLIKDEHILLIRHSYGSQNWTVPGGGVKAGESPVESAKREMFEEVGITLSHFLELGNIYFTHEYKKDTVWVFAASPTDYSFTIDETEIVQAQWFLLSELPSDSSSLLPRFLQLMEKPTIYKSE